MRKLVFLLVASVCLFLLPAAAQAYCYGVPPTSPAPTTSPGHVCGTVDYIGHNGSYYVSRPAHKTYVKICPAGSPSSSTSCRTSATAAYTDGYGKPVQAFIFSNFSLYFVKESYFDLYTWSYLSSDSWGSSTTPISQIRVGRQGYESFVVNVLPRPTPPNPIYPSGFDIPSSYTVSWDSGIDQDRQPYPVTYEIWYKYWPFGASEPSNWVMSAAGLACHDNGTGPVPGQPCSTYVAGPQPAGNWKWYVVANLDVSRASIFANSIFSTKSGWISFEQPQ